MGRKMCQCVQQMLQERNGMDEQNKTATCRSIFAKTGFYTLACDPPHTGWQTWFYEMAIELEAIRNLLCLQRLA
jgi:hypothetical protein